jgi:hypothetical protein
MVPRSLAARSGNPFPVLDMLDQFGFLFNVYKSQRPNQEVDFLKGFRKRLDLGTFNNSYFKIIIIIKQRYFD